MYEIELARLPISLAMLSVASYSDMKRREVSDIVWIIFGAVGVLLYFFESLQSIMVLYLAIGIIIGLTGLATKILGQADCLGLVAVTITMPNLGGLPVGLIISLVAPVLASIYGLGFNIACNISDLIHGRLFLGINERTCKKIVAFFVAHRKRGHEKFVFKAQDGDRFVFQLRPKPNIEFAHDFQGYAISAQPLIPFMLVSLILVILFRI